MVTARTVRSGVRLGLVVAAPALLMAACGGSSGSAGGQGYGGATGSTNGAGSTASSVTVETHRGGLGTYLTDGSGRSLYLFEADHGSTSVCTGPCASLWPPLTTKGKPATSGQADAGQVGTSSRGGGTMQVTYHGHPLYYYAGDQASGDTSGQGINGFGGLWWVVSPAGAAITHASGGSGSPSGSSSQYGSRSGY